MSNDAGEQDAAGPVEITFSVIVTPDPSGRLWHGGCDLVDYGHWNKSRKEAVRHACKYIASWAKEMNVAKVHITFDQAAKGEMRLFSSQ